LEPTTGGGSRPTVDANANTLPVKTEAGNAIATNPTLTGDDESGAGGGLSGDNLIAVIAGVIGGVLCVAAVVVVLIVTKQKVTKAKNAAPPEVESIAATELVIGQYGSVGAVAAASSDGGSASSYGSLVLTSARE